MTSPSSKSNRRKRGGSKKKKGSSSSSSKSDDPFGSAGVNDSAESAKESRVKRTKVGCKPKPHQKTIFCQWYQSGECMRGEHCFYQHEYDSSSCPMSYREWKAMRSRLDAAQKKRDSLKQAELARQRDEKLVLKSDQSQSTVPEKGGSVWSSKKGTHSGGSLRAKLASDAAASSSTAAPFSSFPPSSAGPTHPGMYYSSPFYSPFGPMGYHQSPHPSYYYGQSDPYYYTGNPYAVTSSVDAPTASGVSGDGSSGSKSGQLDPSVPEYHPSGGMMTPMFYPPAYPGGHPAMMMGDPHLMHGAMPSDSTAKATEECDDSDESDLYFQDENGEIVSFPKEEVYTEEEMKDWEYRKSMKKLARDYARTEQQSGVQRVDVSAAEAGGDVYGLDDTQSGIPVTVSSIAGGKSSRDTSPESPRSSALLNRDICPYFLNGSCRHSIGCRLAHHFPPANEGRCPCCLELISEDPSEQRRHLSLTSEDGCSELKIMAKERRDSQSIECDVCYEKVLSKVNGRFGILPECEHRFCLNCIRNWRGTVSTTLTKETIRSCPVCRINSWMVIPSDRIPANQERKVKLIDQYTYALSVIDCKFYCRVIDSESGKFSRECPFGTSCLYRHRNEDGSLQDRKALPSGLLLCKEGDGRMRPAQDVFLSDVISDAFTRSVRSD